MMWLKITKYMTPTNNKLKVQDVEINIRVINEADYISLIPSNSGELKMKQGLITSIVLKNVLKF